MIKRLRKFRQSKQGAILVMVVLILALAMIFIASAMMLTQATRTRLYKNTVASQARLTVTTAAEVFLEALETQEITDAQLDAMLLGTEETAHPKQRHTDNGQKIKMVVDGTTVPGMTTSPTNCTYLDLYYPDTDNLTEVYADFTTIIGDDIENVRLKLIVNDQQPTVANRFSNQIDIDSDIGIHALFFREGMGMTTKTDLKDNTVLVRGSSTENATGSVFYSDFIFGGDAQFTAGSNRYEGKLIFLDGATMKGGATIGGYNGDIYFISKTNSQAAGMNWTGAGGWANIGEGVKLIFSGRTVEDNPGGQVHVKDAVDAHTCYFVDAKGDTIAASKINASYGGTSYEVDNAAKAASYTTNNPTYEEITKNVQLYQNYGYADGSDPFPSSLVGVLMQYKSAGHTHMTTANSTLEHDEYATDGTYLPWKDSAGNLITYSDAYEVYPNPLTKEFPYKNADGTVDDKYVITLSGSNLSTLAGGGDNRLIYMSDIDTSNANTTGYYYLKDDSNAVQTSDANKTPYIILIDGQHTPGYRFYFEGGKNFELWSVVFVVYNVDSDYTPVIFMLENNAEVHMGGSNTRGTKALCNAGFISINRKNADGSVMSAAQIGAYIKNGPCADENSTETMAWSTSHKNLDNEQIYYSKYYDGDVQPACYIFGAGSSCKFMANSSAIVEAYIGLYEGATFGGDINHLDNSDPTYLYGRVEASKLSMGESNGAYCMPYCPKPKTDDSKPIKRTAGSKYAVSDIIYYYDATSEDDEG